jgi:hypothetical protein
MQVRRRVQVRSHHVGHVQSLWPTGFLLHGPLAVNVSTARKQVTEFRPLLVFSRYWQRTGVCVSHVKLKLLKPKDARVVRNLNGRLRRPSS